jgi:Trk K+ transport system NAD-binding subunit
MLTAMTGPAQWNGHVIVCGLHGIGMRTVEQLHLAGVRVVVLDDQPEQRLINWISGWGVPILSQSSRTEEGLVAAGLAGAAAVVCVESDDLHSLETALLVGQLRPDVRLVVQLANAAVAHAVEGLTGPGSVLDVAQLAAPSMVEACLRSTLVELEFAGHRFIAVDVEAPAAADGLPGRAATLRELYGDLVPIAVVSEDGQDVEVCPGRDFPVRPGQHVRLLGAPEALDRAGVRWREEPAAPVAAPTGRRYATGYAPAQPEGARRNPLRTLRSLIVGMLAELDRRIQIVIGALFCLSLISVCVLHVGYVKPNGSHMTWLDASYFTVETIGTVGYGDFNFSEQRPWLRVFAIGLMICGAMALATFFALLTNVIVSRRIAESLGRERLTGMRDHVIVIGLGAIGLRVVQALQRAGRTVVIVERDEQNRYLAQARAMGVEVFFADATAPQALETVNLSRASAIAVLTSNDLTNIESALAVRDSLGERWLEVPVVVRLFDRVLARRIERDFGFRHVRSTDALAAPWFVGSALGLQVLSTFYVEHQPFLVASLDVETASGLDGMAMQEISGRTRVIALARAARNGALEYPPRRDTRFAAGDRAYLVGPYEELLRVLRRDALAPNAIGDGLSEGQSIRSSPNS